MFLKANSGKEGDWVRRSTLKRAGRQQRWPRPIGVRRVSRPAVDDAERVQMDETGLLATDRSVGNPPILLVEVGHIGRSVATAVLCMIRRPHLSSQPPPTKDDETVPERDRPTDSVQMLILSLFGRYAGNSANQVCAKCHSARAPFSVELAVLALELLGKVPGKKVWLPSGTPPEKSRAVKFPETRSMVPLESTSYE